MKDIIHIHSFVVKCHIFFKLAMKTVSILQIYTYSIFYYILNISSSNERKSVKIILDLYTFSQFCSIQVYSFKTLIQIVKETIITMVTVTNLYQSRKL